MWLLQCYLAIFIKDRKGCKHEFKLPQAMFVDMVLFSVQMGCSSRVQPGKGEVTFWQGVLHRQALALPWASLCSYVVFLYCKAQGYACFGCKERF